VAFALLQHQAATNDDCEKKDADRGEEQSRLHGAVLTAGSASGSTSDARTPPR
jgi:hypothetical protein